MSLRLLFAIHGPGDPRTAVHRTVTTKADYLRARGHDVDVLSADDLRWGAARLDPLCLPPVLAGRRLSGYDAVVFHSYLGYVFHASRALLDPHRRPATITSFHGLEPLYFQALEAEANRSGAPLSGRYRLMHGAVMPHLLRWTCRASDAVFCLNSNEARFVTDEGWAPAERVYVLPNGVEPECFVERPTRRVVSELLFVGQWLPAKGVRYLVEAFSALAVSRDVRLSCVGTGAPAAVVLAAFPEAVRPRVRVVPSVDRAGLYAALTAADLFVFPSLSEGFSKALLEAMAAGLPVVATPVGAGADLLRDGENALVVPSSDAPALAHAVGRYMDDDGLAARLGAGARATAGRYRLDDVCRRWTDCVEAVVARRLDARVRHRMGRRDVVG
jgi:glycosyltransferase involved in cell wall biosynthesis